ncbi:hypothetical protein AKJ16_DCAP08387 [Drosera capensis]
MADHETSIPLAFLEYLNEKIPGTVILRRSYDDHKVWHVEVDSQWHFKEGWKRFCKDRDLGVGDFLNWYPESLTWRLSPSNSVGSPISSCPFYCFRLHYRHCLGFFCVLLVFLLCIFVLPVCDVI